jgi:hypothetical protein
MDQPLILDNAEEAQCWLLSFEALCRNKKVPIDDDKSFKTTDMFLERCGTKSLIKIATLLPGQDLSQTPYKSIKDAILIYTAASAKLLIAERSSFFQMNQSSGELPQDYLRRLQVASVNCKFYELDKENIQEELVKTKLISGLNNMDIQRRVLEYVHRNVEATSQDICDFCIQCSQLDNSVSQIR